MKLSQSFWRSVAAASFVATAGAATQANATSTTLTQPQNFFNSSENEVPALTNPNAHSIGNGSWQADDSLTANDNKQHLIYIQGGAPGPYSSGGQTSYPQSGKNPQLLFADGPGDGDNVTINDLDSISFDTNTSASPDWFINLFTRSDSGGFGGPQFDLASGYTADSSSNNGFTTHTLNDDGGSVYRNSDISDGGGLTTYSLSGLKDNFGDRSLLYVALGTSTTADNFGGSIDNVVFNYTKDNESFSRTIDLEANATAVPAPSILPLAGLALGMLGLLGLRRRNRT